MHSNILVVAQPRSGGTLACAVLSKIHNIPYIGEYFNSHRYGYNIHNQLRDFPSPAIVKASFYDLKDNFDEVMELGFKEIYHVNRTDPVGMVCSSFISSITDVFHVTKNETHEPVKDKIMDKDFVKWFFSKDNPGGWFYNNSANIPFMEKVNYHSLYYNDTVDENIMLVQIANDCYGISVDIKKLYKDKSLAIKNIDEVKGWVSEYI